jgi:hypothetical protein
MKLYIGQVYHRHGGWSEGAITVGVFSTAKKADAAVSAVVERTKGEYMVADTDVVELDAYDITFFIAPDEMTPEELGRHNKTEGENEV